MWHWPKILKRNENRERYKREDKRRIFARIYKRRVLTVLTPRTEKFWTLTLFLDGSWPEERSFASFKQDKWHWKGAVKRHDSSPALIFTTTLLLTIYLETGEGFFPSYSLEHFTSLAFYNSVDYAVSSPRTVQLALVSSLSFIKPCRTCVQIIANWKKWKSMSTGNVVGFITLRNTFDQLEVLGVLTKSRFPFSHV